MTAHGKIGARAGVRSAGTVRWGGRAAIMAGASLTALALSGAPSMAACNVSGATTTCTGANSSGIYTNTANVVINSLTANITPAAPGAGIWMDNAANVTIDLGSYSISPVGASAIGSNTPDRDLTAVIRGNLVATGPSGPNSSATGLLFDKFNGGGAGSIVNLTHTGNITINGSRSASAAQFPHMGISVLGGQGADGVANVSHTGAITVNSTGVAGQGAGGIFLVGGGGASATNVGDILVVAQNGSATGIEATAAATGNVSISQRGATTVSSGSGAQPFNFIVGLHGRAAAGGDVAITNSGNILVSANGGFAWGINGTATQGAVSVTNTGNISVTNAATSAQAFSLGGKDVTLNSRGDITTNALGASGGIYVIGPVVFDPGPPLVFETNASDRARITSVGNITTLGAETSPGIAVASRDAIVSSTGRIETNGARSAGIAVGGLYNYDAGSGVLAAHLGLPGSVAVINNTGDITTRGEFSPGILATAATSTIMSTGNITTSGVGSPAILAFGNTLKVEGSGNLSTNGESGILLLGRTSNPDDPRIQDAQADSASITWTGNINMGARPGAPAVGVMAKNTTVNFTGNITGTALDADDDTDGILVIGSGGAVVNVSGSILTSGDGVAVSALTGINITVIEGSTVHSQEEAAIAIVNDMLSNPAATSDAPIRVVNRGRLSSAPVNLTGMALPAGVPASAGARGLAYVSYDGFTGPEELVNFGVIEGGVAMNWEDSRGIRTGSPGRFVNAPNGVFSGGFAFTPLFVNAGTVSPGGDGAVGTMYVAGNFAQVSGVAIVGGPAAGLIADGRYLVNVDFANMTADRIAVDGEARLAGEVVIAPLNFNPQTLQPGLSTMRIVDATGGVSDLGLDVADSLLVDYGLNFNANTVDLTANVDFTPEGLNERAAGITDTLGQLALAGGAADPFVSQLMGSLLAAGSAGEVEAIVRQLSPDALEAQSGQAAPGVALLAGGMFSCGEREGDFRFAAEGQCGWMRIGTRVFNHEGSSDTPTFDENATNLMGGVQKAVSENWRIGFSAGIEQSDVTVPGLARSDTDRYQFGAVAKGQYGPIGTYAAVTAGWASGETDRYVPVVAGVAHSEQDTTFYGLHGRLSYTYMLGANWYARPQARVDAVHVSVDAFDETGIGGLGLSVAARDDWAVSFSPSVEIGGESRTDGTLFRPWVRGGLTVFDDAESTTMANFVGAPATVAPFVTRTINDDLFADVGAGLNILTQDYEFRLSYEGRFSDKTDAHDLAVKFIRRF